MITPDQITSALEGYSTGHSQYQVEEFIIGTQVDDWGRFKVAQRSLAHHVGRLHAVFLDRLEAEIEEDDQIEAQSGARRRELLKRRLAIAEHHANRSMHAIAMEAWIHLKHALHYKAKLEAEHGPLTAEVRYKLEAQHWTNSLAEQLALSLIARQPPSTALLRNIFSRGAQSAGPIFELAGDMDKARALLEAKVPDTVDLGLDGPGARYDVEALIAAVSRLDDACLPAPNSEVAAQ